MNKIGTDVKRIDGQAKTTGAAPFGADIRLHGMLYAACAYTPVVCGDVKSIDTALAEAMPGVRAVITHRDVTGEAAIGALRKDHYPLAAGKVYCEGDVLAVVAADTPEQARLAARAVTADIAPTQGVFDVEEATREGAPAVRDDFPENVMLHYPLRKGDVDAAWERCDHVLERTYRTAAAEHAYIEPESVTAALDTVTGGVRVLGSIQNPYTTRGAVAAFLGLPLNRVSVEAGNLGGSFGGKDDTATAMACRAALLCRITGRPVQLTSSREQSIRESYKRHPYVMRYKLGFMEDGELVALQAEILADSGAVSSQTWFVTWRSLVQATGPYSIPNVRIDIRGVYTNNPYTGAFRGYGSPQVIFAQEQLMDEAAAVCGLSPDEMRRRNALEQNAISAVGQTLDSHHVSLRETLDAAVERSDYVRKRALYDQPQNGRWRRGIGLALSYRGCSLGAEGTDASSAMVSVTSDGGVFVASALHENGQGLRTTYALIVAETLGVSLDTIVFLSPHTSWLPDGGPTVASRGTLMGGKAVELAARKLKETLCEVAAAELGEELVWANDVVCNPEGETMRFADVCAAAAQKGKNLAALGWWKAPAVSWDEETGQGDAYFTYVYGCQVVEAAVDTVTGRTRVERVTAVHDAGRIINRQGALGQVYGGVLQGLGYGLIEDLNIEQGRIKAHNFDEFLAPTAADAPDFDVTFIEHPDPNGPYGAKSLGEPTLEMAAAAVANAVAQAVGRRSRELPLTLERVKLGEALHKPVRQSVAASSHREGQAPASIQSPASLNEALHMLATPEARALAGGTDVMVEQRAGRGAEKLISLHRLDELRTIGVQPQEVTLGACATMRNIVEHEALGGLFPSLAQACRGVGSRQIRNRATVGGNLCNAAPCADTAPALIALEARVELRTAINRRTMPVAEFIQGAYNTGLAPDELMTRVIIPALPDGEWIHLYEKVGRRAAVNISRLSMALLARMDNGVVAEARLAVGSLLDRPCRLHDVERVVTGKPPALAAIAARETLETLLREVIGGRWSAGWKIPVALDLLADMLKQLEDK